MNGKKPIVVINKDAEALSYYESIDECIRMNNFPAGYLYRCVAKGLIYKCMRFIHEPVYRKHWMDGTLDQLKFATRKERIAEKVGKMLNARKNPEVETRRKSKLSEFQKSRFSSGIPKNLLNGAAARRRHVRCIETGEVYGSVQELADFHGVRNSYISRMIRTNHHIRGLHYEYLNKIESCTL